MRFYSFSMSNCNAKWLIKILLLRKMIFFMNFAITLNMFYALFDSTEYLERNTTNFS